MFEQATREKLRFMSSKGDITVEQLWDVPLRANQGFNLDAIARSHSKAVELASEESFVDEVKSSPGKTRAKLAFSIVKHVIDVKLMEEQASERRASNKQEREKLLAILAEKQEGKLTKLSEEELKRRINATYE